MISKNHTCNHVRVLTLKEHTDCSLSDKQFPWRDLSFYGESSYARYVERHSEPTLCFQIDMEKKYCLTNYMIGVDWIEERHVALEVVPKLTEEGHTIDYSRMLMDALSETENLSHLDDLLYIDYRKPFIPLETTRDILSPFLIALFLNVVKRIVSKGLKKSYYQEQDNLESKVRGKIMIGNQIKKNVFTGHVTRNYCSYQEYGVDIPENRLIAKALVYCQRLLECDYGAFDIAGLRDILRFVSPSFQQVSTDISTTEIKNIKVSPLYAEYRDAVKYADLLLHRFAYNISSTRGESVMTPPYWIDMTKLFELYVYKKLRETFSAEEVKYHFKAHYRELDFILHSKDERSIFVIDTKYKPRYFDHSVDIEDLRQIAGYARLEKVYKELKIKKLRENIDCLIIYAHQSCDDNLQRLKEGTSLLKKENGYVNIYTIGISLPEIEIR